MEKQRDISKEPQYTGTSTHDHLIYLRDTFSDTIPARIVHSADYDNRYKVRINWWAGLIFSLESVMYDNPICDSELKTKIQTFVDDYMNSYTPGQLTTATQISEANSLINEIVKDEEADPMMWTADKPHKLTFV